MDLKQSSWLALKAPVKTLLVQSKFDWFSYITRNMVKDGVLVFVIYVQYALIFIIKVHYGRS